MFMRSVTDVKAVATPVTDAMSSALVLMDFLLLALTLLRVCWMFRGIGVSINVDSIVFVVA